MKKLFYLAVLTAGFSLVSCSSDDDNTSNTSTSARLLPKLIENTYYDTNTGATTGTSKREFTYDGNKLKTIKETDEDGYESIETFTYTGNNITSISEEGYVTNYQYVDNLLKKISSPNNTNYSENFTYENNSIKVYNAANSLIQTITVSNGNIMEVKDRSTCEYDTKNGFMKDVTGWDKIFYTYSDIGEGSNYTNNVIKITESSDVYTTEIQYNSNNYPTIMTSYRNGKKILVQKVTYY